MNDEQSWQAAARVSEGCRGDRWCIGPTGWWNGNVGGKPIGIACCSLEVENLFRTEPQTVQVEVDSRTTLLDLLREQLSLTGTKKGCDQGACGACTVLIDNQRMLACLTLAATLNGKKVRTIEGLAQGEQLHPLQEAFLRCDAYQCGYCTPGQIMSALGCIQEGHVTDSVEETREWMSGNLCRCSAYPNIVAAIRQAAGIEPEQDPAVLVTRFDVVSPDKTSGTKS